MNVLLVACRVDRYPLDLGSIYSYLSNNSNYKLTALTNPLDEELLATIMECNIDVVVLASNPTCARFPKLIKDNISRKITIIAGGLFFIDYEAGFLAMDGIDYGIKGPGEETTLELLRLLEDSEKSVSSILGLVYKDACGKIQFTGERNARIQDYPLPNLNVFNDPNPNFLAVKCSIGCSNNCYFCSFPEFLAIPIDRLAESIIAGHQKKYYKSSQVVKVTHMMTYGNFYYSNDDIKYLIQTFRENNINSKMSLSTTIPYLLSNPDKIKLLRELGIQHLFVGVESIHDEILQFYNKNLIASDIYKCIDALAEYNISMNANILVGGPNWNVKNMTETINFIESFNAKRKGAIRMSRVWMFPGSKFYRDANLPLSTRIKQLLTDEYVSMKIDDEEVEKMLIHHRQSHIMKEITRNGYYVTCPNCNSRYSRYNPNTNFCWECGTYVSSAKE